VTRILKKTQGKLKHIQDRAREKRKNEDTRLQKVQAWSENTVVVLIAFALLLLYHCVKSK